MLIYFFYIIIVSSCAGGTLGGGNSGISSSTAKTNTITVATSTTTIVSTAVSLSTTKTTTTAAATTTSANACSGVSAWSSSATYVKDNQVTYSGSIWTAQWWTLGDSPGGSNGVWVKGTTCPASLAARSVQSKF